MPIFNNGFLELSDRDAIGQINLAPYPGVRVLKMASTQTGSWITDVPTTLKEIQIAGLNMSVNLTGLRPNEIKLSIMGHDNKFSVDGEFFAKASGTRENPVEFYIKPSIRASGDQGSGRDDWRNPYSGLIGSSRRDREPAVMVPPNSRDLSGTPEIREDRDRVSSSLVAPTSYASTPSPTENSSAKEEEEEKALERKIKIKTLMDNARASGFYATQLFLRQLLSQQGMDQEEITAHISAFFNKKNKEKVFEREYFDVKNGNFYIFYSHVRSNDEDKNQKVNKVIDLLQKGAKLSFTNDHLSVLTFENTDKNPIIRKLNQNPNPFESYYRSEKLDKEKTEPRKKDISFMSPTQIFMGRCYRLFGQYHVDGPTTNALEELIVTAGLLGNNIENIKQILDRIDYSDTATHTSLPKSGDKQGVLGSTPSSSADTPDAFYMQLALSRKDTDNFLQGWNSSFSTTKGSSSAAEVVRYEDVLNGEPCVLVRINPGQTNVDNFIKKLDELIKTPEYKERLRIYQSQSKLKSSEVKQFLKKIDDLVAIKHSISIFKTAFLPEVLFAMFGIYFDGVDQKNFVQVGDGKALSLTHEGSEDYLFLKVHILPQEADKFSKKMEGFIRDFNEKYSFKEDIAASTKRIYERDNLVSTAIIIDVTKINRELFIKELSSAIEEIYVTGSRLRYEEPSNKGKKNQKTPTDDQSNTQVNYKSNYKKHQKESAIVACNRFLENLDAKIAKEFSISIKKTNFLIEVLLGKFAISTRSVDLIGGNNFKLGAVEDIAVNESRFPKGRLCFHLSIAKNQGSTFIKEFNRDFAKKETPHAAEILDENYKDKVLIGVDLAKIDHDKFIKSLAEYIRSTYAKDENQQRFTMYFEESDIGGIPFFSQEQADENNNSKVLSIAQKADHSSSTSTSNTSTAAVFNALLRDVTTTTTNNNNDSNVIPLPTPSAPPMSLIEEKPQVFDVPETMKSTFALGLRSYVNSSHEAAKNAYESYLSLKNKGLMVKDNNVLKHCICSAGDSLCFLPVEYQGDLYNFYKLISVSQEGEVIDFKQVKPRRDLFDSMTVELNNLMQAPGERKSLAL